jgi:hypothetical protein
MITSNDMRDQIQTATDASDGTYDIDAILADLQDAYGTVDIDTIDTDAFWTIVLAHVEQ